MDPSSARLLAHKYFQDVLDLEHRLNLEPLAIATIQTGEQFSQLAGVMGESGAMFLQSLAVRLERGRRRGLWWRGFAVTVVSLLLLLGGVFADKLLSDLFHGLLWVSIVTVLIIWSYDRAVSILVERHTAQWRLEKLMDAIEAITPSLLALRQHQSALNAMRKTVEKPSVTLVELGFVVD